MARKTATYVVQEAGRDHGKRFLLTEMSAYAAERWAVRAIMAMGRSGVEVPDELAQLGLMGLAKMGISAFLRMDPDVALPLLDELMRCVKILPSEKNPGLERELFDGDIEEVATLVTMKVEVFKLHTDFSIAAGAWISALAGSAQSDISNTQTSQGS